MSVVVVFEIEGEKLPNTFVMYNHPKIGESVILDGITMLVTNVTYVLSSSIPGKQHPIVISLEY